MVAIATGVCRHDSSARPPDISRALDSPLMRLMDALMAFPSIVLAIAVSAVLGASVTNVMIALSIATTPHTARIVRASVLVVRELEYVEAARALGASDMRILFRHVLINALGPLIVRLTYVFAIAILSEAALSFIGVGPPPPTPTFGRHHRAGARLHARGAVDHDLPRARHHGLACSASICWVTACATSSTRA